MVEVLSAERLNQINSEFWAAQQPKIDQWMANKSIRDMALDTLRSEAVRGIPLNLQMTLEGALQDAWNAQQRFATTASKVQSASDVAAETETADPLKQAKEELARQGGKAKPVDALQRLIERLVGDDPTLTMAGLLDKLRSYPAFPEICDVTETQIEFEDRHRIKYASISGLKDRLSRAKKKLRSQIPASANLPH